MYLSLCICLALMGLLVINLVASILATGLWRCLSRIADSWSAAMRARILFLLRMAPGAAAVVFVGVVFITAYIANEPRQTTEIVTAKLGLLSALSLYGIGFAAWHGCAAHFATRRLLKDWMRHAVPAAIANLTIPAFRIPHRFPLVAIVGAVRPKLFIADHLFRELDEAELAMAMAHERGHLTAGDNLRRGLLSGCRNLLGIIPAGRSLERAWRQAIEWAADEHAVGDSPARALDLAAALVKIARLAPPGARPSLPAAASLIAEDMGLIQTRVVRLARLADLPRRLPTAGGSFRWLGLWSGISILSATAVLVLLHSDGLVLIHAAMERIVSLLQ